MKHGFRDHKIDLVVKGEGRGGEAVGLNPPTNKILTINN